MVGSDVTLAVRKSVPRVCIILLNWNSGDLTAECLRSIERIQYQNFYVIVVDNGSTDGSAERLREEFPWIRVMCNGANLGFAEGNNRGIVAALGDPATEYLLILNNDTVVDEHILREFQAAAEGHSDAGMFTAKIYYFEPRDVLWFAGSTVNLWTLSFRHIGMGEKDAGQYDCPREIGFVTGCCMFVRREVIERVGAFEPGFFIYCEDTDWSLRVRRAGFRLLYVPTAKLWHKESASIRKNAPRVRSASQEETGRGRAYFHYYLRVRNPFLVARRNARGLQYFTAAIAQIARTGKWVYKALAEGQVGGCFAAIRGCVDSFRPGVSSVSSRRTGTTGSQL